MKIGVSITCYKRWWYMRNVLEGLKRAEGVEDVGIHISIDGSSKQMMEVVSGFRGEIPIIEVKMQGGVIDVHNNTREAILMAYRGGYDAILHLEEDIVICRDGLRVAKELLEEFSGAHSISLTGERRGQKGQMSLVFEQNYFTCTGFCARKDKIKELLDNWVKDVDYSRPEQGWAWHITRMYKEKGYKQIRPVVSRIVNIGAEGGRFSNRDIWEREHRIYNCSDEYYNGEEVKKWVLV